MYISKEKTRKINALILRTKVHTRKAAFAVGEGQAMVHLDHWTIAHYSHLAVQALLGDKYSRDMVEEAKDQGVEEAAYLWNHYVGSEFA